MGALAPAPGSPRPRAWPDRGPAPRRAPLPTPASSSRTKAATRFATRCSARPCSTISCPTTGSSSTAPSPRALEDHAECAVGVDRVSELAHHWDAAEDASLALRWLVAAARHARDDLCLRGGVRGVRTRARVVGRGRGTGRGRRHRPCRAPARDGRGGRVGRLHRTSRRSGPDRARRIVHARSHSRSRGGRPRVSPPLDGRPRAELFAFATSNVCPSSTASTRARGRGSSSRRPSTWRATRRPGDERPGRRDDGRAGPDRRSRARSAGPCDQRLVPRGVRGVRPRRSRIRARGCNRP